MLAVLFALLSAASFGLTNATARRSVITGTVTQAVAVSMPIGLAMFAAAAAATGQLARIGEFSPGALALLAAAGVGHFVIGRYCAYRSMQAMGANLSGPLQQWTLLVTITLAIAFLDETLDVMKLLGIGLLVLGPALVVGSQKTRTAGAAKFEPRLAEGYLFGILSCFAWGTTPVLVRAAIEDTGLALAAGVVSYGAATLAVGLILLLPVARRDAAGIDRRNMKWFVWAGVMVCVSQIFHYLAMAIAPLTLVQPLMQFQTVFRTLFGWVINREHEVFNPGVLAAIGISLAGALLLTLDAGLVMGWAPPWLRDAFAWRWPR